MSQPLRLAKEALERRPHFVAAAAMEIEMALYGELASFQPGEITEAFGAGRTLDALSGRERVDLAAAIHEIDEQGEGLALWIPSVGKSNGRGKAQFLLAPPERADTAHLLDECFLVGNVRRKTGWRGERRVISRGLQLQQLFEDLERTMARCRRRLGHGHILHGRPIGINAAVSPFI
jgi:hypothetical protein